VENGADVALAAYDVLAKLHPDIQFEFAVRKHWNELKGVQEIVDTHSNVKLRRFPYTDGVTIAQLLLESICVVMPIRDISIDPQLVIVETLAAGVPVITTDHRSNPEIVTDGITGILVPLDDVQSTITGIEMLLCDRAKAIEMGVAARADIATRWNWDAYVSNMLAVYASVIQ
jgi:glycosyltransferase involved in cell wall biosynthesis